MDTNVSLSENMLSKDERKYGLFDAAYSRWKLIFRNVLLQRSRNLMLGALIFFTSLVIVYFSQFLQGVVNNFSSNLITLASGDLYISSKAARDVDKNIFDREYRYFQLPAGFQNQLAVVPGVASFVSRLEFDVNLVTELDSLSYRVMAFDPAIEVKLKANFEFAEGRMFMNGEYGIIVPVDFARRHEIKVGDQVRLLVKAVNNQPNLIDYTVTGLFATQSLSAWFDNYVYLDLNVARVLINDKNTLTRLNVNLIGGANTDITMASLNEWMKTNMVAGNPPIDITHWKEGAAMFNELTGAMQLSYMIMISIIIVMLSVSLSFSTMMNIIERTKEIATLGALGASPRMIRQFLISENMLLAAVAALFGMICAAILFLITAQMGILITSKELSGFLGSSHFYPAFNFAGYVAGMFVPLLVAFLSSFTFARRASKLPIAVAMADR